MMIAGALAQKWKFLLKKKSELRYTGIMRDLDSMALCGGNLVGLRRTDAFRPFPSRGLPHPANVLFSNALARRLAGRGVYVGRRLASG